MDAKDEKLHEYPKDLKSPWKENYYFNFIDRENNAWGINHVSLMRHKQKGRFSAFHVIDGEQIMYSSYVDIEPEMKEITDGKLKFEFLEPFKKFKLTFDGDKHKVELDYDARFEVFDYAMGKNKRGGKTPMEHYEQALFVKGKVEKDGKTIDIDCLGHRDHSWGYRNESQISGWNWIAVQFPNMTVNMSRVTVGAAFMGNGFISDKDGNTRIIRVNVDDTKHDGEKPLSSVFTGTDKAGKVYKFQSEMFSQLYLPMKEKGDNVVVYENFAEYTDLETGEKGIGIDEYLVNKEM
jgi:hypothetical protein